MNNHSLHFNTPIFASLIILLSFYSNNLLATPVLKPVSLQLKWKHQFQFAGYYAAKEKGYYKDAGLSVEIRENSETKKVIHQVVNSEADFGVGGSAILSAFVNGKPIVAIAAIFQNDPMVLFSQQSSGIVEPKDLIGKKVMFMGNSDDSLSVRAMLLKQGIDSSQYHYFNQNYDYQGLIDKKIDVIAGYLSNETYWYKSKQTPINIIKPFQHGINFYDDILFTSQQYLKANPETVEKFRRASLKGWRYAVTHIDEMVPLIQAQYNPSLSHDKLVFEAQEIIKLMEYPVIEIGHMHQQRWEHIANILRQLGLINKDVDFVHFIYQPVQKSYWYAAYAGLILMAILLLIASRHYFHHRILLKSIKRLNLAYGTTGQAWFDLNIETGAVAVSDEYARLLGFSPTEFHTSLKEWQENIHPDDREKTVLQYCDYLQNSNVCQVEYRRKTKSGQWVWLHSIGQVIEWDNNGMPSRAVGVHVDISERKQAEMKLIDSEQRLRLNQAAGGIGSWEYDYLSNTSVCSSNVAEQLKFPWAAENSTWDDVFAVIYPEDHDKVSKCIEQHLIEGKKLDVEYRITDTEGNMRWMRTTGAAEFDMAGAPLKLRGTVQDVTAKKVVEEKMQLSAQVFDSSHEGIMITNGLCNIVDVNPAFTEITGYSRADVLGKNPKILSSGKHNAEFYKTMWDVIAKEGRWQGEVWNRNKAGTVYAELLTVSMIKNEQSNTVHYVGVFTDITKIKEQQEKLSQLAHYDVLTQLPNRTLLADRFKQALARSQRNKTQLAVCFLDLDGFKPINDNFGHETGDQILIEVAQRITKNIREIDTVSRQGGDEFVILLNDVDSQEQCTQTLERIHQALAKPQLVDDNAHQLTASSGVTLYPADNSEMDELLRHADEAMYLAKRSGKNGYQFFVADKT